MQKKTNNTILPYTALFCSFLSKNKLSHTSERIAIADTIALFDKHFTIHDLHSYLKEHKYNTSLSTLYSNLNLLIKAGLLHKYTFESGTPYYEKCMPNKAHNHIYNIHNHQIIEFQDSRISQIISDIERKYQLKILQHDFILYTDNQ
ncbi:MAG: transcriptional repressor [Bacteroidales bacterium]|nr:transcriptional repressor [Bacteroidales bacterium]